MSEQTIQDGLYSTPVELDKYTCRSLGATTIKDLVKNKEITGLTSKECNDIKANKPDVLILNMNREIVVFIEMKQPSEFKSDELKRIAKYQELLVAKQTKAKIYVISDGDTFVWFNPLTEEHILDEDGKPVLKKINPKDLTQEQNKELAEFIDDVCYCIDGSNNQLIPKDYIDPTPLAKKTARILQNMSLSSAKNSLYTFVEMFTFKFLSDIGVLKGIYRFDSVYDIYSTQNDKDAFKQYLSTVREQLLSLFPIADDNTSIINGRLFHTQVDEMGNPIIIDSAANCFGRLLDCFKEYENEHGKFLYINKDFKSKLFETFMKNSSDKDGMGQFFTPLKVVQEMVRMVDVREGMSICDPACGVAKFLLEASSKVSNPFYFENGVFKHSIKLYGMEKRMEDNNDDLTTILAKANLLIYYSDLFKNNSDSTAKIQKLSKELLNTVIKSSHSTLGTLEKLDAEKYDLILANPPYYQSAVITEASKTITLANSSTKAYTTGGLGIETLFIEWIIKSLKKGGEANIILPDGIFTNIGNDDLKDFIGKTCFIESIISLPVGTFFNTPKKTFILTVRKRTKAEIGTEQVLPVFAYLCSTIGETMDAYRFDIDENDLNDAVTLYSLYKNNKEHKIVKDAVTDNPRAKLLEISKFKKEESWDINLFWSDKEKEELGIKKKDNVMSIDEFNNYISELVDDIKDYQEALKCLTSNI
ncbi:MAG: methylase [Eubacterium sp.]|jgi:type I restriction-modification system DNA methylase subunit|nr:methylase [Eubacterium sp.]